MFKKIAVSHLTFVFFAGLAGLSLAGCTMTDNPVDCVSKPKMAIGKCFAFPGKYAVFAVRKPETLYALEQDILRRVKNEYDQRALKEGQIGAKIDVAVNGRAVVHKLAREMHLGNVRNIGLRDINCDQRGRHTAEDLNVVVEDVAFTDSTTPVFKVRVANKVCAGAELWISAKAIKKDANLVSFSH